MTIIINSQNKEKRFIDKDIITIGTDTNCDFVFDMPFDFLLTLRFNPTNEKYAIINNLNSSEILFKGESIGQVMEFESICKLMFKGLEEFISIKVIDSPTIQEDIQPKISPQKKLLEKEKSIIENERVSIVKKIAYITNDLKKKLSQNQKMLVFINIALFFAALINAFAVSNYLMGLSIKESSMFTSLPTNIKVWVLFTVVIFAIALVLKQGVFVALQNKKKPNHVSQIAEKFMLTVSSVFFIGVYAINLIYYLQGQNVIFAIFVALFFVSMLVIIAISAGFFKNNAQELQFDCDKVEYQEDFEKVINAYKMWIEKYINALSDSKINEIKDKLFNFQLKSIGEILLGIITAPFLAYGVSNTLAACFPEAAGWIRISGLRFSPVFLVLATFLIVFAFFAFANAFYSVRKIQGSNIIKQDGFSNYLYHGVDIYGVQGIKKLENDKLRYLIIGISILFIEISMNTSYFMTEIGGDIQGMFMSIIAALVPTALLIAETYMLSQTKFDIYALDELVSKIDKE